MGVGWAGELPAQRLFLRQDAVARRPLDALR